MIVLEMVSANAPLHKWREFRVWDRGNYGLRGKEDTRKIAAIILKQCGHKEVVELVAKEFDQFPERLRVDFRTLATQENALSGNVRKGLQRLNEKMGGKLLREETARVFNRRVETADGVRYKRIEVNEAIASAKRKYGRL